MDEKIKYIEKYKKLGYNIEDENGVIIFYVDSYSKSLISQIKKIVNESSYQCSWGIRPKKGTVVKTDESDDIDDLEEDEEVSQKEYKETSESLLTENVADINKNPKITPFERREFITDDLEEAMKKLPENDVESSKNKEDKSIKVKEDKKEFVFTQETLFDLFD